MDHKPFNFVGDYTWFPKLALCCLLCTHKISYYLSDRQITICNYDSYQSTQHNSNTIATQQQHNSNTVATTIEIKKKNDNKENKENNSNTDSGKIKDFTHTQKTSLYELKAKKELKFKKDVNEALISMNGESEFFIANDYLEAKKFIDSLKTSA